MSEHFNSFQTNDPINLNDVQINKKKLQGDHQTHSLEATKRVFSKLYEYPEYSYQGGHNIKLDNENKPFENTKIKQQFNPKNILSRDSKIFNPFENSHLYDNNPENNLKNSLKLQNSLKLKDQSVDLLHTKNKFTENILHNKLTGNNLNNKLTEIIRTGPVKTRNFFSKFGK